MNTAEPDIDQQAELSGSSLARVDWPIMLHMGARADEMARNDLPYILDLTSLIRLDRTLKTAPVPTRSESTVTPNGSIIGSWIQNTLFPSSS